MKLRSLTVLLLASPAALAATNSAPKTSPIPALLADTAVMPSEAAIRKFLHSTAGTYGWNPVKGTISYDFFPDGRLHIQGPDGEATMWEGKWKLKGDQLTLTNSDKKTTKTVKVTIEGADLLLDGSRYKRYKPQ